MMYNEIEGHREIFLKAFEKFPSAFRGHLMFGKLPLEKRMGLTPTTFEWEGYYAMRIGIGIKYTLS
jgi:hypothetical protein